MPYKAIYNGETKPPQSVPEKTEVECPECGGGMHVVKSHERDTGAFVSRHFRHPPEDGHNGGGGGGGASCGESDEHIKLKSIAASKLEHIFEDNCWKCELEYTFENTATDADHRQADAVLLFDDLDEQLGQGVAIEVQYKNKDKDTHAVERDYIENNISTVWVTPDDFADHNLRLNEADIRARAKAAVWPKHVPKSTESAADYLDELAKNNEGYKRTANVPHSLLLSRAMVGARYYVQCPSCGNRSGSYSPEMAGGGRMCSCGTNFKIDTENYCAGPVLNDTT